MFSPDGQSVYVANSDGVSRYDLATQQITWLTKDFTYMTQENLGVDDSRLFNAQFSRTAKYVVVGELIGGQEFDWVYTIPHS